MKPFDENARCSKCGHEEVETGYCRGGYHHPFRAAVCMDWYEHLHRKCKRCGHTWEEAPLDTVVGTETPDWVGVVKSGVLDPEEPVEC